MELEPFNIRNVLGRLIYDSYMSILRISPNGFDDNPDALEDDPTAKLSSLRDSSGNERYVKLSDSDGNDLGIEFKPMAFPTILYNTTETVGLINITTKATNVFVTQALNVRSSIDVGNDNEDDAKKAGLIIRTKGSTTSANLQWLLYPTESPNDSSYFNDKNKLNLFSPLISESPYKQTQELLHELKDEWYNVPKRVSRNAGDGSIVRNDEGDIEFEDVEVGLINDNFVKVNGRYIFTKNKHELPVPILQTKDYTLGNYHAHSFVIQNDGVLSSVKEKWSGNNVVSANQLNVGDRITKLSWLRLDDLIWKSIEQVLNGNVRHYEGRYTNIGGFKGQFNEVTGKYDTHTVSLDRKKNNESGIYESGAFFDGSTNDTYKGALTVSEAAKKTPLGFLSENGELLGLDVAPGLIMYNAMPLHRWAFHELRLRLMNLEAEEKSIKSTSTFIYNEWRQEVKDYRDRNILTPYNIFNESFTNNLTKNFILCDGRKIVYDEYPAINTSNRNIFKINDGQFSAVRDNDGTPVSKEVEDLEGVYLYIKTTPNLMSFIEKAPRIIRGATWTAEDLDDNQFNPNPKDRKEYVENSTPYHFVKNQQFENEDFKLDYPIDESDTNKVYAYNYNISPKSMHKHNMFVSGGTVAKASVPLMGGNKNQCRAGRPVPIYSEIIAPTTDSNETYIKNGFKEGKNDKMMFTVESSLHPTNKLVPVGMLRMDELTADNILNESTSEKINKIYLSESVTDNTTISYNEVLDSNDENSKKWWLMKASELEGTYSLTEQGGWRYDFVNVYWFKCGKRKVIRHCTDHKLMYVYSNIVKGGAGAYYIGAADDPYDKESEYTLSEIERGISSLPYESVRYLGGSITVNRPWNNENQERDNNVNKHVYNSMTRCERYFVNSKVTYGDLELEINDLIPLTPSVSLLPLMRI